MSLRRLRYFVTVADELSFTAAARVLHMAQPPLSTQIRALERELGEPLFRRSNRSVSLTAAGEAVLPEARALLARYDTLGRVAQRGAAGETGRLAIGLVPSAASGRLPELVARFIAAAPDVDLVLSEDRPPQLLRGLAVGELDLVLQYAVPDDDGLDYAVLSTERLMLAVPAEHRLAGRARLPVSALRGESLILPARHGGDGLHERIVSLLAVHEVDVRVVLENIWLVQTIVGLVSAGMGVAVVPESAATMRGTEVAYLPISKVDPVQLVAVWRAGAASATVRRFIAVMQSQ